MCYGCHKKEKYLQFNPHRYQVNAEEGINEQLCLVCHSKVPDRSTMEEKEFALRTKLDTYCVGCHPKQVRRHPMRADHYGKTMSEESFSFFRTAIPMRVSFIPFSEERLICSTCHNPHQRGVSTNKITQKGEDERGRLRLVGYEMCAACHRGSYGVPVSGAPF